MFADSLVLKVREPMDGARARSPRSSGATPPGAVSFSMGKRLALIASIGLFVAAARADDKTNYITAREITAMAPVTATFAKRLSEFSGSFTNAEGRSFILGDIRGEQWVWHFVGAL